VPAPDHADTQTLAGEDGLIASEVLSDDPIPLNASAEEFNTAGHWDA
jgi:hypothetical protein